MDVVPLVDRILVALGRLTTEPIEQKRMFGGVGFMWRGYLVAGTHGADELLVRLAEDADPGEGLRPMVMRERVARGWYFAAPEVIATDDDLEAQLTRSMRFVEGLPPR